MTILHHKLLKRWGEVFGQWMNSFLIHGNICALIHKNYHPKSYHNDMKYHFSVVHILIYHNMLIYYKVALNMLTHNSDFARASNKKTSDQGVESIFDTEKSQRTQGVHLSLKPRITCVCNTFQKSLTYKYIFGWNQATHVTTLLMVKMQVPILYSNIDIRI